MNTPKMNTPKMIFVGNNYTGKTYNYNKLFNFPFSNSPTILFNVNILRNYNKRLFIIYDFSGNSKYNVINKDYFENVNYCILFDDKNYEWKELVRKYSPDCIFYDFLTFEYFREFFDTL
jgi:GTPase SAR1 family protein